MFSIVAINEEIEVFTERDDFAANVDPDNIEYILNELKERLNQIKTALKNGTYDSHY